jgi:hypothetical protein
MRAKYIPAIMLNMQGCVVSDPGEGGGGGGEGGEGIGESRKKSGEGLRERGGERGAGKIHTSIVTMLILTDR